MRKALPVVAALALLAGELPPTAAAADAVSLTPYAPASYTNLYTTPDGPITGSTYIFSPTPNFPDRIAHDFAHMRDVGVNTVGFYNLVQMSDADRDTLFTNLENNNQKAMLRIEWYDANTFDFDDDGTHDDAESVLRYYDTDDPAHGYTALLTYLKRTNRLRDIAYFSVNMPVDDGTVAGHFTGERSNPRWASSQPPYAQYLLSRLRQVLGASSKFYLSVFYGWDQSYPTPGYAGIPNPADGYFFNNYSYPAGAPPTADAPTSTLLNQPRLQTAMDKLVAQYPTQPKVVEYGFHTVDFNNGVPPAQTAGLVQSLDAKRKALPATTSYYRGGSSNGVPFRVRGTMYFAQNLYKEEGDPAALMDWTLDYPATAAVQAEDRSTTGFFRNGHPAAAPVVTDAGGQAVPLRGNGSALEFYGLATASAIQVRYRAARPADLELSVNGAAPRVVRVPAARDWRVASLPLSVPRQGAVRVAARGDVLVDWLRPMANLEAEATQAVGADRIAAADASDGASLLLRGGRPAAFSVGPVAGGSHLTFRYAATAPARVRVLLDGHDVPADLPATGGGYASRTVPLDVPSGTRITVARGADGADLAVDYLLVTGQYEAEAAGGLYNGAHGIRAAAAAEGAAATSFDVVGASMVVDTVIAGTTATFRYAATRDASMTVIVHGQGHRVDFPSTGGAYRTVSAAVPIPAGATVIVQRNADDQAAGLTVDWLRVSG
ncbi:hypothetical protein QRX60_31270 [Amycolatopsis mongoliensis]|uniref:Uncharacterized protein n=1 Tax=Amycolatopsis mongoliensis TaxID=715475 RepID=A0A9Y2JHD1_9PSEU|nr:hypothetical protein [Amycolatopsis sp. 4-36]WIX98534.1 hypothetical protein QRX60_31270 [Amycolatopsis sp. 4-36]